MKKIVMKIMGGCCAFLLLAGLFACKEVKVKTASSTAYFFDRPARMWEETFPLGNGRLGMMPDGGLEKENFQPNISAALKRAEEVIAE